MKRPVEQDEATQVLERDDGILRQVREKLLEILELFEASHNPKYQCQRVRILVVGKHIDGAHGGIPANPEVVQETRNELVEGVINRRVVGEQFISDPELVQD